MLGQFIVGIAISSVNLGLHAAGTIMLDRIVQRYWGEKLDEHPTDECFLLLICVGTGLMVAHFLEVLVWAFFYDLLGVSPPGTDAVYFALSQYTTLGHGEAIPLHDWALLGPITAANGLLLFGWSTAVIFEVVRTTIPGLRA
jgi:Ion channel